MLYDKKYQGLINTITSVVLENQQIDEATTNKTYKALSQNVETSLDKLAEYFRNNAENRDPKNMAIQKEYMTLMNNFYLALQKLENKMK
jgi:hypothetical protein